MPSQDTITEKLRRCGVPERYLEAAPRPDLTKGAYLYGPVGTGKTYAACGALRAFIEKGSTTVDGYEIYLGKRALFVSAPEWFAKLRSTYDARGESEVEVFERYAGSELLVLDDLGKGGKSEWAVERLYMLLDQRYANGRPTIITSNYNVGQVAAMMSTDEQTMMAIASRITGMCQGVEMRGEDMRRKF